MKWWHVAGIEFKIINNCHLLTYIIIFFRLYREGEHAQDVHHDSFIFFPPAQQTMITSFHSDLL